MHETECSGLVHWEDPGGNDGEGGGRGVQDGEHITPMADSCQCVAKPIQYCKVKEKKKKRGRAGEGEIGCEIPWRMSCLVLLAA